ncbi:MAG: FAD-dependent oxidoreductase, partial [Pseudomonadota bacterium]
MLNPAFGLKFSDLYRRDGLLRLDTAFVRALETVDGALCQRLLEARADPSALAPRQESELLIALAPHVEDFISELFGIATEVRQLSARHHELAPLYSCKRLFVQRKATHKYRADAASQFDGAALRGELAQRCGGEFSELAFAQHVTGWLQDEAAHSTELDFALRYAAWAALTPAGNAFHAAGVLFKAPHKLDQQHLVRSVADTAAGYTAYAADPAHWQRREGFKLSDHGTGLTGALDQANYCIWCHEQGKDSCSKGLREKGAAGKGVASFKKSAFGVTLAGCPLEEKISEFHKVKTEGLAIGALAMITVDNPMVAATGHRICNDCMKACIYQKQEPVDIPQAETRTLKDVLELPWGFEIYSLLTRWNPLNLLTPYPRPASGRRVLVAGMGPAGFTLAHYLMNDGHLVVGVDGLKIEPLPPQLSGVDARGARVGFEPVRDVTALYESLDDRVMAGFGGVAEYGITVRWNKNFLKLIRLLLERREQFALFGGVRFGGTLTLDDAFAIGFDHIALAVGAGKPTILDLPNGLARGVRAASDFLMALQLTGAAKADSIANMELRLPAVVIGGGLTAIDTATESLAYYPVQVEKFLQRYETLAHESGEAAARLAWNDEERVVADEFLAHAHALRAERTAAQSAGREPRILELLQAWGGVTIAYRRRLIDSPAYTLNHEEVQKALEEGVRFAEGLAPEAIEIDEHGHARAIRMMRQQLGADGKWSATGAIELAAKSILIAAGTQPNTVLAREDPAHFALDGRYFRACDEDGNPVKVEAAISKPNEVRVLLARHDDRYVSYFGDVHPSFFGNVVKAMGSAKQGYPLVSRVLARTPPATAQSDSEFVAALNRELRATIHEIIRLTPQIIEVVVHARLAAKRFRPGQFYRFQNFETLAPRTGDTTLTMEGLALTGAAIDAQQGLISTIVLEMGGSSDLCRLLKPG